MVSMFMLVIRWSAIFITITASASVIEQAPSSVAQQSAPDQVLSAPPSLSKQQSSCANSSSHIPIAAALGLAAPRISL
jgi:hypothetical protein